MDREESAVLHALMVLALAFALPLVALGWRSRVDKEGYGAEIGGLGPVNPCPAT